MQGAASILDPFAPTLQKTESWMKELMAELHRDDPRQAYRIMRATLHALRDRLLHDEVADLAAQLPAVIRGLFYEGWKPSKTPTKERSLDEFLEHVNAELIEGVDPDPRFCATAVFKVLASHITGGEVEDVRRTLPKDIAVLWPDNA